MRPKKLSGKSPVLFKVKSLRRKVFFASAFIVILFLLAFGGWLIKSDFGLSLRTLDIVNQSLIKPVSEVGIEAEAIMRLKKLAVKEELGFIGEPRVENDTLVATFSGQLTCLLGLEKDIDSQLASLQFIFWRSKIEGKKLKSVDLRFEKPVVEYGSI